MKVRLKKVGSLFMVISMVTIMFYGCGRGNVKDTTISPVTTVTTESTAATSSDTTVPPVSTTVDHVKEYDHREYVRQLDNLKYGEAPEYLKQIGVPSEEDVAFIRENLGEGMYIVTDPVQVWDKNFHESKYRCGYMGTFDIGDGESIVYFIGLGSSDNFGTISPSVAYYKKSGKVWLTMTTPQELKDYKELFSLRYGEYINFSDVVSYIIY